ncbi:hypothetical protein [Delftia sp. PS-11]|uniref:hypothetical protein n=1 Tax=Delftia sp. PS-11 TaxID=2767222 RepID=UPI00245382C7|nr:hypothetical protein [Delftia sp. PS-11]KAJ8740686.1 hypothetical protein H9T68_23490 [Delftia sp. PS-11]
MTAITTAVRLLREAATELKKSHTLNGDWGNEHDALTAYNAHIAAAADLERIAPQCLAQIQEPAAVAGPAPAGWRLVPAVPTREWIGAVADDGYWDCDCAQLIANILSHAPAAPALEAPAAPECERCGLSPKEHNLTHWCDNQSFRHEDGTVQLGVTEQPLAAAPQAPAAPWKDHQTARLVNDLRDCAKTYHAAGQLRERIAFIVVPLCDQLKAAQAAPAAPAVDAPKELDPGLSREVYRACEDLPEGWSIRIDLENGYGSVKLIDPDGEENELQVDGWLSDAMRASIAAAQAKEGGAQ